ncbi:MAG: hypothetical protein OXI57_09465 [Rhodospirillales bacterium]|nr:hypothetical protein [Rhodospirillales bacterium]
MHRRFTVLAAVLGLALLAASPLRAAEMPAVDALQAQMGAPAGTVTVYEPHLSVGDAHVAVDYVGYPAIDVMARLFGPDWQSGAETVEFRALDGYVSRLPAERFLSEGAFIVFARGDGSPFTVDNLAQNETGVPLGPYYLIWDNIGNPALLAEGARNWPYQVAEVNLVTLSDAALLPPGLDERFHEGAALAKTHCLSCHLVNGYGGRKFEANLAEVAKVYDEAEFVRLILEPLSVLEETTMPPLSDRLAEAERQRIAKALFDYLQALPVLE